MQVLLRNDLPSGISAQIVDLDDLDSGPPWSAWPVRFPRPVKMPKTGQMTGHDRSDLKPCLSNSYQCLQRYRHKETRQPYSLNSFLTWHCYTDQNKMLISTELDWHEWNCFNLAYYNLYFELWSWPWFKFWNHFSMVPFLKLTDRSGPWPLEALNHFIHDRQSKTA